VRTPSATATLDAGPRPRGIEPGIVDLDRTSSRIPPAAPDDPYALPRAASLEEIEATDVAPSVNGAEAEAPAAEVTAPPPVPAGPPRLVIADAPPPPIAAAPAAPATTPEAPGLRFEAPAIQPAAPEPQPEPAAAPEHPGMARVFRAGDRDAAGHALVAAAHAYDELGQYDSAATIYRSLGRSSHAGVPVLEQWLRNCELRDDPVEAAQVACELGDRALSDGDEGRARTWFSRAAQLDPSNALAHRRLERLAGGAAAPGPAPAVPHAPVAAAPPPAAAPAPAAEPAEASPGPDVGRVEVAVGRGQAVTFDLGSLVAEFQRGVEAQLSYREMGLLEQAVEAFRTAAQDPGFIHRSAEMIGRCMLDQGRFDDAAQEFESALASTQLPPHAAADLRYHLGLAHEAAGRPDRALAEFERVYAAQPSYPDVAQKIRELRKALENH
jgi:tetratricopeptide (TPR) repeat protein